MISEKKGNNVFEIFNVEGDQELQIHVEDLKRYVKSRDPTDEDEDQEESEENEEIQDEVAYEASQMSDASRENCVSARERESREDEHEIRSEKPTEHPEKRKQG